MTQIQSYPIGTPGQKWTEIEISEWRVLQNIKRSYKHLVIKELELIGEHFKLNQYGALSHAPDDYPLFVFTSANWDENRPTVLVTGGVHGYETSGVHGAIRFAQKVTELYLNKFNLVIAPCVSPWGYETINRWNINAIDPNRSFHENSPSEEAALLMAYIDSIKCEFIAHIDLHETTDTDNSEFRPALAARDAKEDKYSDIPDGFYLVGDTQKPQHAFQAAIINQVKSVTHIAPADENNELIGTPLVQYGVINYEARELGLCMGLTDAPYVTTTEVYPDSALVDNENCIKAQEAVINTALDYILATMP